MDAWPNVLFRITALPYDWLTTHPAWWDHCAELIEHFPAVSGRQRIVLDLGCGPGASALTYAQRNPTDRVVGLDIARPMLERAVRRDDAHTCTWVRGDAAALPFATETADVVTGHSFLYLLPDRDGSLEEMRRVLRPTGRLVLMEPTHQTLGQAWASVRAARRDKGIHFATTMALWRLAARMAGGFTEDALRELLGKHGFEVTRVDVTLHGLGLIVVAV